MVEDGPERSKIEVRIPLNVPIDFGQGSEIVYTFSWQIPEPGEKTTRFVPAKTSRRKVIREAISRLTDTEPFDFSSSGYYESNSTSQSGIRSRRRGGFTGRRAA